MGHCCPNHSSLYAYLFYTYQHTCDNNTQYIQISTINTHYFSLQMLHCPHDKVKQFCVTQLLLFVIFHPCSQVIVTLTNNYKESHTARYINVLGMRILILDHAYPNLHLFYRSHLTGFYIPSPGKDKLICKTKHIVQINIFNLSLTGCYTASVSNQSPLIASSNQARVTDNKASIH